MLEMVISSRSAAISAAIKVKRILPWRLKRMVGPFIFVDHAGPIVDIPPLQPNSIHSPLDVLPHPHIGLSTISYLFGGQITHRDSLGIKQIIHPGEVNWMTAGRGIVHSERFEDPVSLSTGKTELIQTWVALPEKDEETAPAFQNYESHKLPIVEEKGLFMRLIAGEAYGLKSEVKTHSPLFYIHSVLGQDIKFEIPKNYSERGIYIAKGSIELEDEVFNEGQMLVFKKNVEPKLISRSSNTTLMILGGEPLGERFMWWNFVSSRKERIEQAKEDWKQGRLTLPPHDNAEFIPLPEDIRKPSVKQTS